MKTCPRSRLKKYPSHIDESKLPDRCNFDPRGKGRWYISYKDENGKRRTCGIGDSSTSMSELHKRVEEFFREDRDNTQSFLWLADKFANSKQFKELSAGAKNQYKYARKYLIELKLKNGKTLGDSDRSKWKPSLIQIIIDKIAQEGHATKAKHVKQYLSRLFNWGLSRGYCADNPVKAIELPKERKLRRLPSRDLVRNLIAFSQNENKPHYIWKFLEVGYLCRLRGIELREMTEDQITEKGLLCRRAKGSRTNITEWNDRLRFAIDQALNTRDEIWKENSRPFPLHAKDRLVFVNQAGDRITKSGWDSGWQRFLKRAIQNGVMTEDQIFGLHDMKRRGTTDTQGTDEDKMKATGHKERDMLDVYDQSIAVVKPAGD